MSEYILPYTYSFTLNGKEIKSTYIVSVEEYEHELVDSNEMIFR